MNIWIVNPYGTLPSEGWRHYRSFMLAKALAGRGHTVTWWMSNFEHRTKTFRSVESENQFIADGIKVVLVDSPSYSRNISFGRLFYEKQFGRKFYELAYTQPRPDLLVIAEPSIFYCKQVVKFAEENPFTKLVVDVLDLWPELFAILLPSFLRKLDKLVFAPLYFRRKKLLERADGIVTVTADYMGKVTKGMKIASEKTLVAYLGVDVVQFETDARTETPPIAMSAYEKEFSGLTVVYAGTLGDAYDMETFVATIELCITRELNIRFLIAGSGPKASLIGKIANKYPLQICYLGSVSANLLPSVYRYADVGLCLYSQGSTVSMPVKLYDYLAAGLVIINSLDGEIRKLVLRDQIGLNYVAGDSESLFQQFVKLQTAPDLASRMAANAKKIGNEFDSNIQHQKFADFIEQL